MKQADNNRRILVVSNTPELTDITRKTLEGSGLEIDSAPDEVEGLRIIREKQPAIVILGRLEPPETVLKFYNQLRAGWISHHASILVVELNTFERSFRILGNENLISGIGDYIFQVGAASPLIPLEYLSKTLAEAVNKKLREKTNQLKHSILDSHQFCLVWEQIPGLGAFEMRQENVIENAGKAARGGKICAISITDNPGGNPAIATDVLCTEIRKLGIEPIVHIAFRDRSRNQCESLLYQLEALEINNVLVLSGDYPSNNGFNGKSKPVFDLDSVNGLQLIAEMNKGLEHEIMRKKTRLSPTHFFAGAAFSPFKQMEAEVMGQYFKLKKKIEAGADFIITQVGYDARKLHELQMWLQIHEYKVPVLASIYVLSYPVAKAMRENSVPGCVVTDALLSQIAAESNSPDKGKQARLERAAKMYAITRGLGFSGAYISGQGLPYESVEYIIFRGNELAGNWLDYIREFNYPQEKSFYYFEKDPQNGLNLEIPSIKSQKPVRPLIYSLSRAAHAAVFEPKSPLFKPVRGLAERIDSSKGWKKPFGSFENWVKTVLYGCKDCGDCALFDVGYLCPVSQCPKEQRNAPCGGSFQGWCEVYPYEKQCIWVKAYLRLKSQNKEDSIGAAIVPPRDWELWQTPSWLNYFLGRDHISKRIGIKPPDSKS
jgi:methylenetetrahydrofolate reductase (NADPH)